MSAYRQQVIEQIAKTCHETNRAYCASLGDHSQPPWAEAPETSRLSAMRGVEYALMNPDATPKSQHDAWLRDKEAQGFVWGPIKNLEGREHPCMVPYDQLPKEQQTKDYLFQAVVRSMEPLLRPLAFNETVLSAIADESHECRQRIAKKLNDRSV